MNFDLSEFLDSLNGLTRTGASRLIESEMDKLDKFNRRPNPTGKAAAATHHRMYTREYDFLNNLLYEVKLGGQSEVKKVDRDVIDEVLKNLKLDAPLKIIKKAK